MEKHVLRLPPETIEGLKTASGERGVSDEIRRRLEASLLRDRIDPKLADLLQRVELLSDAMEMDDKWYENRFAFEVFKAGVVELLDQFQPSGEMVVGPNCTGIAYGPKDDPATAGRALARFVTRDLKDGSKA